MKMKRKIVTLFSSHALTMSDISEKRVIQNQQEIRWYYELEDCKSLAAVWLNMCWKVWGVSNICHMNILSKIN